MSTAEPPAHGSVFAVPRTPFAPPATLENGAPTAPVAAPPFVDPWADAGAGDPMLGGEDALRAPRAVLGPGDAAPSSPVAGVFAQTEGQLLTSRKHLERSAGCWSSFIS